MTHQSEFNIFDCPFCNQPLEYEADMRGMQISCPSCFKDIRLPGDAPLSADSPSAPTPPPKAKPKAPFIANKISTSLGAVFAATSMTTKGFDIPAACLAFLLGAGIGYSIEALRIGLTAKKVLATVVGVLVCGGFLVHFTVSQVLQSEGQSDSVRASSHGATLSRESAVDQVLQAFPNMSAQAKSVFRQRAAGMSENQTAALLWQLVAEGETLLSNADQNELFSLFLKAVKTLTPEEQIFIHALDHSQGHSADHLKSGLLGQEAFGNLPEKDNSRFLELRGKAAQLALLKQDMQVSFNSNTLLSEADRERMEFLHVKAIILVPESQKDRQIQLWSKPIDQLTQDEYAERLQATQAALDRLSPQEKKEFQDLAARALLTAASLSEDQEAEP